LANDEARQAMRERAYWSRILADLKNERIRAVQPPLWPEEETKIAD
jgi:hypothetical protein